MFLSLTIICVVAGAILAGVNMYTTGPIAATKAATLEKAIKEVTPEFNNKPTEEAYMAATSDGDSLKIYPAKQDGKFVGAAVESNTMKGFGGEIRVIVGFDIEGKLLNYSVLQHAETPGLGAKMQEWFLPSVFSLRLSLFSSWHHGLLPDGKSHLHHNHEL